MFENIDFTRIKKSKTVAVITGAGISQESGIPTFRGSDGYWKNFRAEELATPEAFRRDPALVWEWYDMRRQNCQKAEPNLGHEIVKKMEDYFSEFLLITQNVDNLHVRAGNKKILEIHGNISLSRCTNCKKIDSLNETPLKTIPPRCNECNHILRPHIVWFGESYDPNVIYQCSSFLSKADFLLVVGTSGQVSAPVSLALHAIDSGAYSIEVNPDPSTLSSSVSHLIQDKAGVALPKLWDKVIQS